MRTGVAVGAKPVCFFFSFVFCLHPSSFSLEAAVLGPVFPRIPTAPGSSVCLGEFGTKEMPEWDLATKETSPIYRAHTCKNPRCRSSQLR